MKTPIHRLIMRLALAALLLSTISLQLSTASAQGTGLTYQGQKPEAGGETSTERNGDHGVEATA